MTPIPVEIPFIVRKMSVPIAIPGGLTNDCSRIEKVTLYTPELLIVIESSVISGVTLLDSPADIKLTFVPAIASIEAICLDLGIKEASVRNEDGTFGVPILVKPMKEEGLYADSDIPEDINKE
ncbi:hypothetical protein [Bacillus sp. C1]